MFLQVQPARSQPAEAEALRVPPFSLAPWEPGEPDLLCLLGGVPEGCDLDDPVAVPLDGLSELDVEGLTRRGTTVPSGRPISPVKVPVTRVTTVIQSPLPNWIGYGSLATWTSGKTTENCSIATVCAARP